MKVNLKSFSRNSFPVNGESSGNFYGVFNRPVYVFGILASLDDNGGDIYSVTWRNSNNEILFDQFNLRDAGFNRSGQLVNGRLYTNSLWYPLNSYVDFANSTYVFSSKPLWLMVSYAYSNG